MAKKIVEGHRGYIKLVRKNENRNLIQIYLPINRS